MMIYLFDIVTYYIIINNLIYVKPQRFFEHLIYLLYNHQWYNSDL